MAVVEDTGGEARGGKVGGKGDCVVIGNVADGKAGGKGDDVSYVGIEAFLFLYMQLNFLLVAVATCFVLRCLSEAIIGLSLVMPKTTK